MTARLDPLINDEHAMRSSEMAFMNGKGSRPTPPVRARCVGDYGTTRPGVLTKQEDTNIERPGNQRRGNEANSLDGTNNCDPLIAEWAGQGVAQQLNELSIPE